MNIPRYLILFTHAMTVPSICERKLVTHDAETSRQLLAICSISLLLSEVCRFYLVMPAAVATAGRGLSAMRRTKSYFIPVLISGCLNSFAVLHVNKELDNLNIHDIIRILVPSLAR